MQRAVLLMSSLDLGELTPDSTGCLIYTTTAPEKKTVSYTAFIHSEVEILATQS